MFDYIHGKLSSKSVTQAVLDCGGVGYSLAIPLSTYSRLPRLGDPCKLFTHLVVREDNLSLIGFSSEEERTLFQKLIGVSGIGPATAMAVLSGFTTTDFIRSVQTGDLKALTRVKGLGKKTAERLIVDLKDSFNKLEGFAADKTQAPELRVCADAVMALIQLGYSRKDAEEKVTQTFRDNRDATVEELIKLSL